MVRVFTLGVPDQEDFRDVKVMRPTPTLSPTPIPSGPTTVTPIPTYRIFVNGIPVQHQNRLMQIDAGTVTLSQSPKSDGAYKVGSDITLVASSSSGFVVTWGEVDTQTGAFATVEMVSDRYVTLRMAAPTPTPRPTRTPFPWDIPAATTSQIPVPSATGVLVSDPAATATPVPNATPTPLPPVGHQLLRCGYRGNGNPEPIRRV